MAQEQLGVGNMELRDAFAACALNFWARMNIGGWCGDLDTDIADSIAKHAYILADAMMEARSKT